MSVNEALGADHVAKRYGECVALRDASISVKRGTAHALIGENGAGKSTLMKILYGLERADRGEVRIDGAAMPTSVELSLTRGIGMVHQHFMLVPTLSVVDNVVLGREPRRFGLVDRKTAARRLEALSVAHGLPVDPYARVGDLSVGEAQRVEILKVLYRGAKTLILDEPTAMLTPPEVEQLLAMLRALAQSGSTVLIVTHKLGEVLALADEVTVLRRGEVVDRRPTAGLSAEALGAALVGRTIVPLPARASEAPGAISLELASVRVRRDDGIVLLDGVQLQVRAGEIVGVAGVEGNGQRELAELAAGLRVPDDGQVRIAGKDVSRLGIAARHSLGLGYVPEDRQEEGLLLDSTLWENLYLGREGAHGHSPVIPERAVQNDAVGRLESFDVRPPDPLAKARALSGGNQQKVLMLRELGRRLGILVCAQPTRGVDIGAIAEIHARLIALADAGCAILLVSAELDELFALADRLVVLYRGKIIAEHAVRSEPDRAALRTRIGTEMLGLSKDSA